MSIRFLGNSILAGVAVTVLCAGTAFAGRARPWLCRDKPVFSSNHPMDYSLSSRAGVEWRVFFMSFQLDAANDGFDIVASKELGLRGVTKTGKLPAGRYYTVAMYRQHAGVWVCHKYSRVQPNPKVAVANICYGRDEPTCVVNLSVKNDMPIAVPVTPVPVP